MLFRQYNDPKLAQYAYLVGCQKTGEALLIDPLRDIDQYVAAAEREGLTITAVAETHIHADFLSGAREFADRHGAKLYLSAEGEDEGWPSAWAKGSDYDVTFLRDGDTFAIGNIDITAVHTPGHTPEHLSYVVVDRGSGATTPIGIATGDFVFVGDLGRPDLLEQAAGMHGVQEDSARTLFQSLPKFRELQDYLQVWPAHGAGSTCGKALGAVPTTTVGYEKLYNASLAAADGGEETFVDAILDGQPEPQMYFARMKRDNRDGVPLLGTLPTPPALTAKELAAKADAGETLVVDTRLDRSGFMAKHIPGALYAPMNKSFNTVVGSLVVDETTPIVLVIEAGHVEEAVRDLVRIGYDNVVGYATPDTLERYVEDGGETASIPEITFEDLARRKDEDGTAVVDVRFASEYAGGHVPGAVNASYTRLPDYETDRIPSGKTLLVHCASGARSAAASAFLAREGYDVAYVNGAFGDYAEDHEVATGSRETVEA
ncbi:MBL fold metallo-hydrolase [Rubricoccus marinus]|uniref:MBL fold metallo-hydrolase n=1 Tax=Rubricoccus marinus TaxID=716817 RepID=A0A259TV00_9BACT|nr:MBL fold metallo-hydrolase [Rubricoccus marinus]OZC01404.1 MBL fold metallo-hydrolase [Rubricoccus marinus]